jgi:type VI protein secretion system component Hcp
LVSLVALAEQFLRLLDRSTAPHAFPFRKTAAADGLACRKRKDKAGGGQQDFITISFSDLIIASFNTTADNLKDLVPRNDIQINFSKIEIAYQEQTSSGSVGATVTAGYDLKKNAKV